MQLDHATVALRPRGAWEAVDLGWLLVGRLGASLWRPWLVVSAPLWILAAGLGQLDPLLGLLVLWWLQPLGERVLLHVLAGALFGAAPALPEVARELPRLLGGRALLGLVGKRLQPTRLYVAPVSQLERLRGSARARRETLLLSRYRGVAFLWTALTVALRLTLFLSIIALCALLLPAPLAPDWGAHLESLWTGELANSARWFVAAVGALVLFVARPFQVAAGFALYVSRRTALEGWDVEQAFRLLAARLSAGSRRPPTESADRARETLSSIALCLGLLVPAGPSGTPPAGVLGARAAPQASSEAVVKIEASDDAGAEAARAERALDSVLASPDFGRTTRRIRWSWFEDAPDPSPSPDSAFAGALALVFQVLAWVVVAGLVGAAAAWLLGSRASQRPSAAAPRAPPTTIVGLDLRPESLPSDVSGEARSLWNAGRQRDALALLYRAAIEGFVREDGLELEEGDTERDCLRRLERVASASRSAARTYFSALTAAWQTSAYARRRLDDGLGPELVDGWKAHFGART